MRGLPQSGQDTERELESFKEDLPTNYQQPFIAWLQHLSDA